MPLETELRAELKKLGADFVSFVDISNLAKEQNKGFPTAILFGITFSPAYLQKISNTTDYVKNLIRNKLINEDEFHLKERKTDELADTISGFLASRGYTAHSQSENNIYLMGLYDAKTKTTPLPHKTIALMAGLGWIGKHNLLVTHEFGSAISMCSVLTDAPLMTVLHEPMESQCGNCQVCENICPTKAIKGSLWKSSNTKRDEIVDVYKCTTCIECLVFCPWTQRYMKREKDKD